MTRTAFLYMAALANLDVFVMTCPNGDIVSHAMDGHKVVAIHDTATDKVVIK